MLGSHTKSTAHSALKQEMPFAVNVTISYYLVCPLFPIKISWPTLSSHFTHWPERTPVLYLTNVFMITISQQCCGCLVPISRGITSWEVCRGLLFVHSTSYHYKRHTGVFSSIFSAHWHVFQYTRVTCWFLQNWCIFNTCRHMGQVSYTEVLVKFGPITGQWIVLDFKKRCVTDEGKARSTPIAMWWQYFMLFDQRVNKYVSPTVLLVVIRS